MSRIRILSVVLALSALLATGARGADPLQGFEPVQPASAPPAPAAGASDYPADSVNHGRYLVDVLGCGNCHTDGALVGEPDADRPLAGSRVGIAVSDPMQIGKPGVVYPPNLTPDPETGIGEWSLEDIVAMLQSGVDRHGSQALPVMPWLTYGKLQAEDANAIAMYLKSLPPVSHQVPPNVRPGHRARTPYVHFGVYRSQP